VRIRRLGLALALLVASAGVEGAQAQDLTGDNRLVDNFIQDGAILRQGWLEADGGYASWSGGHDTSVGARIVFSAKDRFEFGGAFGYLDRDRASDEVLYGERLTSSVSENGPADVDLYGKFRFRTAPRDWSAGLLVKLPAADEGKRLGSGSTDTEFFLATRQTRGKFAWIGNASIRLNGDARTPGEAGGKTSAALGGGAILRLSYSWTFLAETRYETRRYDGGDVSFRITPSFDFRPTENLAFRLSAAFGLADGSPNVETRLGAVFHF
jgi:hypothetical protein